MNTVRVKVVVPREIREVARAGLFKKSDWNKVFRAVEREAMGSGGILEKHLSHPAVSRPLAPSTREKKQQQGLSPRPLVGKRGRILKALTSPGSRLRKRSLSATRKRVVFRVFFNPAEFAIPGKKDTITRVLQRGRIAGSTTAAGSRRGRVETINQAKAGTLKKGDTVHRMPGRPVLSYYPGDESKLTPALLKAVHHQLKVKGLAD